MNNNVSTAIDVQLKDLHKTFGGVTKALDGFSCHLSPGELLVLLGPSGCGKTTALRALAGLEDIDAGHIMVGGIDMTPVSAAKRDMAMVFQAYSLFPHLSARQNVEFGLRVRGIDSSKRRTIALEALELVGLADQGEKYTHQMSGGQQQRVALARALVIKPKVLLLDEPLSALDAKVRVSLREEIRRIQKESGITTLFVTHDQEEALAVADRVGVMQGGKLAQIGSPEEIYSQPKSEFVAEFIGVTNRVPAFSANGKAQALGQSIALLPGSATGEVHVLVRPESISLDCEQHGENPAAQAQVTSVSFLGSHTRVTVHTNSGLDLVAQLPPELAAGLQVGTKVNVTFSPTPALAV